MTTEKEYDEAEEFFSNPGISSERYEELEDTIMLDSEMYWLKKAYREYKEQLTKD